MGQSVGRQLAEKGANVIIVARDVAKLREAITYIRVSASVTLILVVINQQSNPRKEQLLPRLNDSTTSAATSPPPPSRYAYCTQLQHSIKVLHPTSSGAVPAAAIRPSSSIRLSLS